jgi:lipoprotein-anchoring transpeptidase ErfK/SrfK
MSRRSRPRYGRIAAFSAAVVVTGTAVLGGTGLLPAGGSPSYAAGAASRSGGAMELVARREAPAPSTPSGPPSYTPPDSTTESDTALPADSGTGRRIVFDISDQRVWLVNRDGSVERTYPVSGSVYDNLSAGTYSVYSRSPHAIGVDDSGTMRFMVRFAHGANAAIGFHDIPVLDGKPVQSLDELGTPQSHGCIRQARPDAKALWRFAPLGTKVVVTD